MTPVKLLLETYFQHSTVTLAYAVLYAFRFTPTFRVTEMVCFFFTKPPPKDAFLVKSKTLAATLKYSLLLEIFIHL